MKLAEAIEDAKARAKEMREPFVVVRDGASYETLSLSLHNAKGARQIHHAIADKFGEVSYLRSLDRKSQKALKKAYADRMKAET